jgi:pyridoxine 4-dehydrogenase
VPWWSYATRERSPTSGSPTSAASTWPKPWVQNRYNPLDRSSERVLGECEAAGIAFLPWGPIQASSGDGVLQSVAVRHGATPQQVALAWLLARSRVILPIPGTSRIPHLKENLAAIQLVLTEADLAEIEIGATA